MVMCDDRTPDEHAASEPASTLTVVRRVVVAAVIVALLLWAAGQPDGADAATPPPPDAARTATQMSWYTDHGKPIACGAAKMPRGARVIATHPSLGIPCGARVSIELADGRRFVFVNVDKGPWVGPHRLVDAQLAAVRRMGLDPDRGVYAVRVAWRRDLRVCLDARWKPYRTTPTCGVDQ